jgi:hypothetical protein
MRILSLLAVLLLPHFAAAQPPKATPGNRLAYLDELDPYYPHAKFPKLITPQWVGEPDVDAVVILAIDDMRDPKKYETFLRPILNRLKKIDGRAPVSIMTCNVDPQDPQLQSWLKEGLSLECHTVDHPCPYFKPGFEKAKDTYDRCVDLMNAIPGNKPVAFRMPCCDSLNTPSPRHWAEIFDQETHEGNYLSLDSSVFMVYTSDDPELPKELVLEDGKERFKKYLPGDREFVNWIENYPYPYRIGKHCWQFPCMMPSDWVAQHLHKSNNPLTVRDWKAALDCTVVKKGVFTMVFHPHGWIKAEQIIELIDHAVEKHGKKVKFLTFKEASERIDTLLWVQRGGQDRSLFVDLNNDGFMDIVNRFTLETVIWRGKFFGPQFGDWITPNTFSTFNTPRINLPVLDYQDKGIRFGIVEKSGVASVMAASRDLGGHSYRTSSFKNVNEWKIGGGIFQAPDFALYRSLDIDGDGICEIIDRRGNIYAYDPKGCKKLPFTLPTKYVASLRFLDLNGDGKLDLVFSNEKEYGVYLFVDMQTGWKKLRAGKAGDANAIPMIARNGKNNGCFAHSGHLWWANEDTVLLKNHVDKRSYKELLEVK